MSEGLTELELAKDIGVPQFTIHGILKGRDPKGSDIWEKLTRYFHIDVESLRFGKLALADSQKKNEDYAGCYEPYRKVPIISWMQIRYAMERQDLQTSLSAGQGMVETEIPGTRVFALYVHDNSMEPLPRRGSHLCKSGS